MLGKSILGFEIRDFDVTSWTSAELFDLISRSDVLYLACDLVAERNGSYVGVYQKGGTELVVGV